MKKVSAFLVRVWPLLAFAAVWLALRVFWLDGDSGIPSFWEYGYHVTDEGYYLSGGKERFLWGTFVDLARDESLTYGYASGMQWLSYLAHLCFGLSTWAWRIPFVLIYFVAACMGFRRVAHRSGNAFALAVCVAVSCLPLVVVYERTASNDALIGAMLVMAYVVASGKGVWRIVVSALLTGAMILVKPSVWVLMPIALAGILAERKTRSHWLDAVLFLGLAVLAVFGWRAVTALTLLGDAVANGISAWQIMDRLNAHYPLPNMFDFATHFKGFSAFPRDPSIQLLAAVAVLISSLPVAMFLRNLCVRKWNAHQLLYFSIAAYVAAVCVMNTIYTHYFLPVIAMLPLMFSAMREDLEGERPDRLACRNWAFGALAVVGILGVALFFVAAQTSKPQVVQAFYSRIYNFPQSNVWGFTWTDMLLVVLFGTGAVSFCRGLAAARRYAWAWALVFFVVASVAFASYPAFQLAPYMRRTSLEYFAPLALCLVFGSLLAFSLFAHPQVFASRRFVSAWAIGAVVLSYLVTPTWRKAAGELIAPVSHVHAEVAAELAKLVPEDAVVIGERTDQAFISLPIRTAGTFITNSDPIPVIERLLKRDPNAKLYAFADSQHAYNLQHYREHAKEYRLDLVKTFKMPSFANGKPADVHLCKVIPLRTSGSARGSK